MRTLLFSLLMLFTLGVNAADTIITATITITNTPNNSDTITVNSSVRTWRSQPITLPNTEIAITNNIGGNATNLFSQFAQFPFTQITLGRSGTNGVTLQTFVNGAVTVTLFGSFGMVSYVTNTLTALEVVRVPFSAVPGASNRTNHASLLVTGINDYATNSFNSASPAMAGMVGITNSQTITGNKALSGTVTFTNSQLVEFAGGSVVRFSTNTSLSFMQGSSVSFNTNANIAFVDSATVSGVKVGFGTTNWDFNYVATSNTVARIKDVTNALTAFSANTNTFGGINVTNLTAYGGTVYSLLLTNPTIQNGTFTMTNTFTGDVAFTRVDNSSLANGNNISIDWGDAVYVKIKPGPTAAFTINGMRAQSQNGKLLILENACGVNMTIANNSGVEPSPANRILTLQAGDVTTDGDEIIMFIYDTDVQRWKLIGGVAGSGSGTTIITNTAPIYNFGDQFTVLDTTNVSLAFGLMTTNITLDGQVITPPRDVGATNGTFNVDAGLGNEWTMQLGGDATLGITNLVSGQTWNLEVTNLGNYVLTITNVAYCRETGNFVQPTNDWGNGIVDLYQYRKSGSSLNVSRVGLNTGGGGGAAADNWVPLGLTNSLLSGIGFANSFEVTNYVLLQSRTALRVLATDINKVVTDSFGSSALTSSLTDETGSGGIVASNSPTIRTPTVIGAIVFEDGLRQTFNPDATTPGINVGSQAGDPSTPANGDLWYDSSGGTLRARINGVSIDLGAGAGVPSDNWLASGTTNSLLAGVGRAYGLDATNFVGIGAPGVPGQALTIEMDALGASPVNGLFLTNTTAAANGAQQFSPAIYFAGKGYATTPAASSNVIFRMYAAPVQGTTTTRGKWTVDLATDGSAFGTAMTYDETGKLLIPSTYGFTSSAASVGPSEVSMVNSGGIATVANNSATAGSSLRLVGGLGAQTFMTFAAANTDSGTFDTNKVFNAFYGARADNLVVTNATTLLGTSTAVTPANGDHSTKIATTEFVQHNAGGNMTNTGASAVGMIPIATDLTGTQWTPSDTLPNLHVTSLSVLTNLFPIGGISYLWPTTNAVAGQNLASDGATPSQLYWTNFSGSALWSSSSGLLVPNPTVNAVKITSQFGVTSNDVAFVVDTANGMTNLGFRLASFNNGGTNRLTIDRRGAITIGNSTSNFFGGLGGGTGYSIASYRDSSVGDGFQNGFSFDAGDGSVSAGQTSTGAASTWTDNMHYRNGGENPSMVRTVGSQTMSDSWDWGTTNYLKIDPWSTAANPVLSIQSGLSHTSGNFIQVSNNGTNLMSLSPTGDIRAKTSHGFTVSSANLAPTALQLVNDGGEVTVINNSSTAGSSLRLQGGSGAESFLRFASGGSTTAGTFDTNRLFNAFFGAAAASVDSTNSIRLRNASASSALITDANKFITNSAVSATALGYVANVTSDIQTQLNAKGPGNVVGSTTSTDEAITLYSGTGGLLIKTSPVSINSSGTITHAGGYALSNSGLAGVGSSFEISAALVVALNAGGVTGVAVDSSTSSGHTRFFVYDVDNGFLERVTVGAADSGGAGFKVLRIPN